MLNGEFTALVNELGVDVARLSGAQQNRLADLLAVDPPWDWSTKTMFVNTGCPELPGDNSEPSLFRKVFRMTSTVDERRKAYRRELLERRIKCELGFAQAALLPEHESTIFEIAELVGTSQSTAPIRDTRDPKLFKK